MTDGIIKLLDQSGSREIDTIAADYEDPITLESFRAHIREHRLAQPEEAKSFIIARVTTLGTGSGHKEYYSYYSAPCLNKILFKRQVSGRKTTIVRKESVQNPLTNTEIVGDVVYFVVKPNPILGKVKDTPRKAPVSKINFAGPGKDSVLEKHNCSDHVILESKRQEEDFPERGAPASPSLNDAKIEIPQTAHRPLPDVSENKPIVARLYEKLRIGKAKSSNLVDHPRKLAECSSKLPKASALSDSNDSTLNLTGDSRSSILKPESSAPCSEGGCITVSDLHSLAPNIYPSDTLLSNDSSSESVYEAVAFATDSTFLKSPDVRKIFEDNIIVSSDGIYYHLNASSSHGNSADDLQASDISVSNAPDGRNVNTTSNNGGGIFAYYLIILAILTGLEVWILLSNYYPRMVPGKS